ncbi:hypothetical protein QQX98_005185 [Neonectria punicea]|uniref:2EXR domain-containing protein n=1 Tax=Neonectria punicea TaxID=979145 RepID=A0ABR1H5X2_9HYPO
MAETFHRFSDLPWELRDIIWNLAVRRDRPGVHFFRIYDNDKGERLAKENDVYTASRNSGLRLSAPKCWSKFDNKKWRKLFGGKLYTSWTRHNSSTYLVDGGMWTACQESRLVMERIFKSQHWAAVRSTISPNPRYWYRRYDCPETSDVLPATGYFTTKDSTNHYFTVLPHQDLFCLQPHNVKTMDWSWIDDNIPLGSTTFGFRGLRHLALEYNPAWGIAVENCRDEWEIENLDIVKALINALHDAEELKTLWFIDYHIKRVPYVPTKSQAARPDAKIFFQDDRQFVEVVDHGYWEDPRWDHLLEYDEVMFTSSLWFVGALEDVIWTQRQVQRSREAPRAVFGILGCEYS